MYFAKEGRNIGRPLWDRKAEKTGFPFMAQKPASSAVGSEGYDFCTLPVQEKTCFSHIHYKSP